MILASKINNRKLILFSLKNPEHDWTASKLKTDSAQKDEPNT